MSLTKRVTINVPEFLRVKSATEMYKTSIVSPQAGDLYVHIFAQEAGQFTPYPNISDSRMASRSQDIMGITIANFPFTNLTEMEARKRMDYACPTLITRKKTVWKLHLEDHGFTDSALPIGLESKYKRTGSLQEIAEGRANFTYVPPLYNDIHDSQTRDTAYLTEYGDENRTMPVYQPTFDIDLELRGVATGWESMIHKIAGDLEGYADLLASGSKAGYNRQVYFHRDIPTHKDIIAAIFALILLPVKFGLWMFRQHYQTKFILADGNTDGIANWSVMRLVQIAMSDDMPDTSYLNPTKIRQLLFLLLFKTFGIWDLFLSLYFSVAVGRELWRVWKDRRGREADTSSSRLWMTAKMHAYVAAALLVATLAYAAVASDSWAILSASEHFVQKGLEMVITGWLPMLMTARSYLSSVAPVMELLPVLVVYGTKSTGFLSVKYHMLVVVELALVWTLCLYQMPFGLDLSVISWRSIAKGVCSAILVIQHVVYRSQE
ncbi:hypothetical protein EC988_000331 [Linderina pennispora]|nr:hypothetical protein EC988_000331 [Linderina pennispora]